MKKSLLIRALQLARDKLSLHPEHNFLHYSFIVQDEKIVEWGTNNKKTPPVHYGYSRRLVNSKYSPKTHSEVDAFKKARGLLKSNKPFEIINIRLNRRGQIRNSKPCECCYDLLMSLGCKKFYYSSNVGFLEVA